MYNMYAHSMYQYNYVFICVCVRVHVIDVQESKCPQVALKVVAAAADIVATAASFALQERSLIKIVEWFPRPLHSCAIQLLLSRPFAPSAV